MQGYSLLGVDLCFRSILISNEFRFSKLEILTPISPVTKMYFRPTFLAAESKKNNLRVKKNPTTCLNFILFLQLDYFFSLSGYYFFTLRVFFFTLRLLFFTLRLFFLTLSGQKSGPEEE